MALNLKPTNTEQELMLAELHVDIQRDCVDCGKRLTPKACQEYPVLIEQAIQEHDDSWLESQLNNGQRIIQEEPSKQAKSGWKKVNQPAAAKMLSEGTWNNLWCRAQCQLAINNGSGQVKVFRAVPRNERRIESEQAIGQYLNAHGLLEDLRRRACDPTSGQIPVPGGPNSGISVRAIPEESDPVS